MPNAFLNITIESWQVLGQMAPYLLFGFLAAGVMSVWISPEWVERHLGGRGLGPVFKASIFGVPLPLCSCSVIPVSASIRRHGASRAATTAFLLSTPQTGVDSIAATYALLGPVFAIFRPVAALITGVIGGALTQAFGGVERVDEMDGSDGAESCNCHEACCEDKQQHSAFVRVLLYGLITLPRDIGLALLIGIVIAGAMTALVPQESLIAYIGGGVASILLLIAASVPVYVCATASVPIAAGLIHIGASPGAALAFLIAGPATNAAAFAAIWKTLGHRAAFIYLLTIGLSALCCGLLFDWITADARMTPQCFGDHDHGEGTGSWFNHLSAIALLAVLAYSWLDSRMRSSVR